MSFWQTLTPEQREEHIKKMHAGRGKKKAEQAAAEVHLPATTNGIEAALSSVDWTHMPETRIRGLVARFQELVESGVARLRAIDNENGDRCSNPSCRQPFPRGRHLGEQTWMDPASQTIRVLRACSPGCLDWVIREANRIRMGFVEQQHSRLTTSHPVTR
jgi:hypothetical protein